MRVRLLEPTESVALILDFDLPDLVVSGSSGLGIMEFGGKCALLLEKLRRRLDHNQLLHHRERFGFASGFYETVERGVIRLERFLSIALFRELGPAIRLVSCRRGEA